MPGQTVSPAYVMFTPSRKRLQMPGFSQSGQEGKNPCFFNAGLYTAAQVGKHCSSCGNSMLVYIETISSGKWYKIP